MKKFLSVLLLAVCTLGAFSQDEEGNKPGDGSRLEALKIAYLTRKLNLSPEEAQRFWPVYNNYATELREARIDQRKNKISELDKEEKILLVRKKYNAEFTRVLSTEKTNALFRSEREFGNFVQKELAERRQMRQLQLNKERIRR